jgi:hypothetical protein
LALLIPGDLRTEKKRIQKSGYGTKEKSINKTLENQIFSSIKE